MKKVLLFLLTAILVTFTGCAGYHPGASKPHQLAAVKKLAVPTFKNGTLAPRIEVLVTDAVIKKLQMDGAYQIVPVDEADAVLRATITDITRRPFRLARENTLVTSELLVGMVVKFNVESTTTVNPAAVVESAAGDAANDDKPLPTRASLLTGQTRNTSYLVLDPNFQLTERQALADAAERLSGDLVSQLTQGW